jgi:hypothetical protein
MTCLRRRDRACSAVDGRWCSWWPSQLVAYSRRVTFDGATYVPSGDLHAHTRDLLLGFLPGAARLRALRTVRVDPAGG